MWWTLLLCVFLGKLSWNKAHEQPGLPLLSAAQCSHAETRPFFNYHIHTMFWGSNNESVAAAMQLREDFSAAFDVSLAEEDLCDLDFGKVYPQEEEMCFFRYVYSLTTCCFHFVLISELLPPPVTVHRMILSDLF